MTSEVAENAPDPCGVWWYEGTDYEGNEHRVAVPVPDAGIPREVVEAAREAVVNNVPLSGAGEREFWELSGGILRCGGCGLRMQAHVVRSRGRVYCYLRCPLNQRGNAEKCPVNARVPAEKLEDAVWDFVYRKLLSPGEIIRSLDELIAAERRKLRGDPEAEVRQLRRTLSDLDRRRERAQDAYLAGAFSVDELRGRQQQLEEARESILREIEATENRGSRVVELQRIRDSYAEGGSMLFTSVEGGRPPYDADPRERHDEYRRLELRVVAHSKDDLEVSGIFGRETLYICNPSPRPRDTTTPSSASTRTASS
jgi:hypothetical protein